MAEPPRRLSFEELLRENYAGEKEYIELGIQQQVFLLKDAPEMPAATPPPDAAAITVDNAGGEGANLRARASSGSESYGLYMNGTKVYLLRWGEWWCRVWADGKTGYMMTKMLDVQQPN